MPTYNFKKIDSVPAAKDFIDLVLSKTQRQTPTVVHKGNNITRIRQFYTRKVKFTQSNWHEKLSKILEDFPRVDDIHPFYADLLNVLYDKDHYKLALGQVNTARNLIDKLAKDYVRLLKYGDSLYRCKMLKKAALGRMCTLMKKQTASLAYLEQVRQHMSRLPSIDPTTRTLLVCGYPNVGKSSFMNKVTRADVEVQPYAFTTKSLFVGHMDYKYLRWQVIDSPGILDRPLEERNTIEMQSITALAHLRAAVIYVIDLSEGCGYTLAQQAALFHSIKPLFAGKPLLIAANKTDLVKLEDLKPEDRDLVEGMRRVAAGAGAALAGGAAAAAAAAGSGSALGADLVVMSTLTEAGVMAVKEAACEKLLAQRVEAKMRGKKIGSVLNRIHVAVPKPRDSVERPPCIPEGVAAARARRDGGERRPTERDLQEAHGGAGVYSADMRKHYDLKDPSWRYDIMPEIVDGHNVADYVDPDIEARLEELEREEEALAAAAEAAAMGEDDEEDEELDEDEADVLAQIRARKAALVANHRQRKATASNVPVTPRGRGHHRAGTTTAAMDSSLRAMGMDPSAAVERARSRSASRVGRKRTRSASRADEEGGEGGEGALAASAERHRNKTLRRSLSRVPASPADSEKVLKQKSKAQKMHNAAERQRNRMAKAGEGDRVVLTKMPKHLFSGKRGIGKTDRR